MIIGIDFGAKEAGTTVIAALRESNKVEFRTSLKGQDADDFILGFIEQNPEVWLVYIDAPLSLPKVYNKNGEEGDFFFREADRLTGAMSPMFLGGLTARAMKLAAQLRMKGIKVVETYPSKLAEVLKLKEIDYKGEKTSIPANCDKLKDVSSFHFENDQIENWHLFDALLCLYSAKRYEIQASMEFGNPLEGTITV